MAEASGDITNRRESLCGTDKAALDAALRQAGVPDKQIKMRRQQIWSWLYAHGVDNFDAMHNVAKAVRAGLAENFSLARLDVAQANIPMTALENGCSACMTGTRLKRFTFPKPIGALMRFKPGGVHAGLPLLPHGTKARAQSDRRRDNRPACRRARCVEDWPTGTRRIAARKITNIVLMGMGEPLYNTDNVIAALNVMSDGDGLALSRRRITLSTSGVVPDIARVGSETGVMLAISLHAVHDDLRDQLVPLNKKYPIAELLDACRTYPGLSNARRITIEYVMLKDVNDTDADARELVRCWRAYRPKLTLSRSIRGPAALMCVPNGTALRLLPIL